jgi:hypothetical protein
MVWASESGQGYQDLPSRYSNRFPLRRFIVRNTSRPTCHIKAFYLDLDCYSAIPYMSILPELLHFCSPRHPPAHSQELRLSDGGRVESSSRSSFIPPQIKDYGLGIPACLAKTFAGAV